MARFLTKKELVIVLFLALAAVAALALTHFQSSAGTAAQVTYDGEVIQIIELGTDAVYSIDARLPVTLQTRNGAIRFIDSVCPNHDCEGFGFISSPPEAAVCLPARLAVQIIETG